MQRALLLVRIVMAAVLGWLGLRFIFADGTPDPGTKLIGLMLAIAYGFVLFLLFGWSFLQRVAGKFSGLYLPSDANFQIKPEYSRAEARLKVGDYVAAVAEYRTVIAQFPDDIYAHIQIATIATEQFNDLQTAETEFETACAKAGSEDAIIMTHGRYADFCQTKLNSPALARAVMEKVLVKLPGTRAAVRATERIAHLDQLIAGYVPPQLPKKIAFRESDAETIRRRRGY